MNARNDLIATIGGDEADDEPDGEHARSCPASAVVALARARARSRASIVGTASMNENSTIVRLLMPIVEPPTIVAAERDTPGMIGDRLEEADQERALGT